MVELLDLADQANVVAELGGVLGELLEHNALPDIEVLRSRFAPGSTTNLIIEPVGLRTASPNLRRPGYPDSIKIVFDNVVRDTAIAAPGGYLGRGVKLRAFAQTAQGDLQLDVRLRDLNNDSTLSVPGENLDVLTIILSNRAYAILLAELRNLGVNEVGRNAARMMGLTDPAPDFVKLAQAVGVEAVSVATCEEFADVLASALKRRGPFLIECVL